MFVPALLMYLFILPLFELDYNICLFVQLFRQLFMKWTKHLTFLAKKKASLPPIGYG